MKHTGLNDEIPNHNVIKNRNKSGKHRYFKCGCTAALDNEKWYKMEMSALGFGMVHPAGSFLNSCQIC